MGYISDLRKLVGSRPLIMAGACVILINDEDELLLQLRKDNNYWGLPGGSLELGENLEQVAKRELYEETSLNAKDIKLFNVYSGDEFYYKYPHGDEVYNVVTAFVCHNFKGVLTREESEVQKLQFFSLRELPMNINPPEEPIINEYITTIN